MAKNLIIGDIHCRKQSIEVVSEVLDKCRKIASKCDVTILTGDINDTKANIRSETVLLLLNQFKDWPTPIIAYVGNHDLNNAMAPEGGHSLEFLKLLPKVTLIDRPTFVGDDVFVPYNLEEVFITQIENILKDERFKSGITNLYCHQDMDFAKYSNGTPTGSQIKADLFESFHRVFVGHVHMAQEFKNIIYVGTPYTESFKESDEEKRVIVFDTVTDKILSAPLGVRQHVTHEYIINDLAELKDVKKDLKTKLKPGQLVRVIIEAPEGVESKIKRSLFDDIIIETLKTRKIVAKKTLKIEESMSSLDVMGVYLKQLDISDELRQTIDIINSEILLSVG